MNYCNFEIIDGIRKCIHCGHITKIMNGRVFRECKGITAVSNPPTLVERLQHLNKTGEDWVAKGNPVPNEDEVQRRLTICKACPLFNNGTCTLCTCNMNYKARLATAHCPDNPPRW
jgi:hypothetical protein